MALVAYSDESDLSSDEEKVESYRNIPIPSGYKPANDFPSPQILNNRKITDASSNHEISSGVDSIEMDEDDDHMFAVPASKSNLKSPASLSLLSSLPAAIAAGASMAKLDLSDDELTDVPTKETWKPAQEILIKKAISSNNHATSQPSSPTYHINHKTSNNLTVNSRTKSGLTVGSTSTSTHSESNTTSDSTATSSSRVINSSTSGRLASTSGSLASTSGSLASTSGSLASTSGSLGSASGSLASASGSSGKVVLSKAQEMALASSALGSLLQKKKTLGGKVQLHLPSMNEFNLAEDEGDEGVPTADADDAVNVKKKLGPSNAGTGLFSLLPKPRNVTKGKEANRSLVPHILSKPPANKPTHNKIHKSPVKKKSSALTTAGINISGGGNLLADYEMPGDEDEEISEGSSDFFSLESDHSIPVPTNAHIENSVIDETLGRPDGCSAGLLPTFSSPDSIVSNSVSVSQCAPSSPSAYVSVSSTGVPMHTSLSNPVMSTHDTSDIPATDSFTSGTIDPSQIDDESWRRLTGKKRKLDELEIIDVNRDDALLSRDELMNQVVSQQKPSQSHSKKKGNLPSQQQKRKHQITYLAHQAKEREIELQNEWSSGKMKKMQTRAKYGF
ncbi:serine-rich adhesin for platelets isoform X1 [Hyalella azteca]|uniref:Serine-rich adhesin for platelets isoform X1 n=1 Tax=Hyalella azteca TaxID=294128 RepID=A0A8B7P7G9_HYAAZ|nr:serine-rich adhesin for platelets isoform X1 [Hyalella azteca]XP_047738496.1 serine-rich adhesin for platelets isoform X1 [Hyalella azteca]